VLRRTIAASYSIRISLRLDGLGASRSTMLRRVVMLPKGAVTSRASCAGAASGVRNCLSPHLKACAARACS